MQSAGEISHIALLNYPGAQQAAVLGLSDLLVTAARLQGDGRLAVSLWDSLQAGEWAKGQDQRDAEPASPFTALVLPPSLDGGAWQDEGDAWPDWIKARHAEGSLVCSVCAGSFLLAETGLLTGRRATTHWGLADRFAHAYPEVSLAIDEMVVDEGDVVTAGGLMAWVDLGLRLVGRFLGPETLQQTARYFLVDPGGREQRYYSRFAPRLDHGDIAILKVQHRLQPDSSLSVAEMSALAGLGERTFLRRFQRATGLRPTAYLQQLRVARACDLLEGSRSSVGQIAWQVGYEDSGAFSKIFQRLMGLTPGDYRRRFTVEPYSDMSLR
ncbi:MAG: helix-turn-helix domain-containing protein [Pseudomonadota bacterium]